MKEGGKTAVSVSVVKRRSRALVLNLLTKIRAKVDDELIGPGRLLKHVNSMFGCDFQPPLLRRTKLMSRGGQKEEGRNGALKCPLPWRGPIVVALRASAWQGRREDLGH